MHLTYTCVPKECFHKHLSTAFTSENHSNGSSVSYGRARGHSDFMTKAKQQAYLDQATAVACTPVTLPGCYEGLQQLTGQCVCAHVHMHIRAYNPKLVHSSSLLLLPSLPMRSRIHTYILARRHTLHCRTDTHHLCKMGAKDPAATREMFKS